MYKLLIADDDEIICRGLEKCIPWEEYGIEVTAAVCDGEMALKCVKEFHPDIALVDINMPFMDGIEFTTEAKRLLPDLKIILITAYREFEYAKKAIELQVFDYVTKPFSNENVLETVVRAQHQIEEERSEKGAIQRNIQLIREKYMLEAAINGGSEKNRAEIDRLLPAQSQYMAAILDISLLPQDKQPRDFEAQERSAADHAAEKIREALQCEEQVNVLHYHNQMIFLFENPGSNSEMKVQAFLKKCMDMLSKEENLFLAAGIGHCVKGNEQIKTSVMEAERVLEYRYYFGHCSVIYVGDMEKMAVEEQVNLREYIEKACESIREGEPKELKMAVEDFFTKLQQKQDLQIYTGALMVVEFLLLAYRETQDGKFQEQFVKESTTFYPLMIQEKTVMGLQRLSWKYFDNLILYLEEKKKSNPEKLLRKAMKYMEAHYDNPALSLNEVAESVPVSASYLCTMFKQHSEYSYISYLNHIRMEQAKRILKDRTHKTYEVAFLVGFNSSQYFSSSFKRYTGMTPGEYRAKGSPPGGVTKRPSKP